jgi:molybdenum cofactor cytidylyltransferase
MKDSPYTAVIPAAGLSSRMQAFKPLLHINNKTVADHVISLFQKCNIDVVLVTGWRQQELISGIKSRDVMFTENPDYRNGMFSSVQAGLIQVNPSCKGVFIMPVDVPLVRPATVKRLLTAAAANPDRIIYPTFASKHGHPTFLPTILIPEVMNWTKEGGLKAVLGFHSELRYEVKVADENIHFDIDEPEDFSQMEERLRKYDIPTPAECDAILDISGTADNIRAHCRKVAEIAVIISRALANSGNTVDTEAIKAGAILHDVAREEPRHSAAGSRILHEFGFDRIANIVETHTELPLNITPSLEAKIVFLADKFVRREEIVSIEERYSASSRNYATTPEIAAIVQRRKEQALKTKKEIEELLGYGLDPVILK